ncbi:MAG: right-handed parallel beta-helix repeat-containing protein [Chloroflexi bacterium]|nr:right-handed parallel beta-helix repeat-containing protein [Chloroflexota bacterium]
MVTAIAFYVSPSGRDDWSGRLPEPRSDGKDGPFASLARARDACRALKESARLTGPVTVFLRGGRYRLTEPLTLRPEDSGPVTYTSFPGERAVIDGGQRITDWQITERDGRVCWVADLPEVAAGRWWFRQLFVNGQRRPRPRLPRQGYFWIEHVEGVDLAAPMSAQLFEGSDRFRCAPGDIQPWRNLGDVEVVVLHYWIEERLPIASFDPDTREVRFTRRSTFVLRDDVASRFARYYVENVGEALAEPGEWYLDRSAGRLFYLPLPGEDPATTEVVAPRARDLLRLIGVPEEGRHVEYVRFERIDFEHAEPEVPTDWTPYFTAADTPGAGPGPHAAAPQGAITVPAAISLRGARFCAVEDCRVAHVGGYGIELREGCIGNRIVGCELVDLGAGGIKLNGADAHGPLHLRSGRNRLTDNHVHDGGHIFPSGVGILCAHAFDNDISYNHIHDLFYSGISCGWVWGYGENVARDNRIEYNRIHDLGRGLLSDLGGIYTLGVQPGTVIRGNVIYRVAAYHYGGWGIYLDEGSAHILVEQNLCRDTSSQGFNQHYGRENIVRNNIFAFGQEGQAALSRPEEHNAFTFERNILLGHGQPFFVLRRAREPRPAGFQSDLNLFWDTAGGEIVHVSGWYTPDGQWVITGRLDHAAWQERGQDRHSRVADPNFRAPERGDFTLAADSPAREIGFQPFDPDRAGPRAPDARE